MDELRTPLKMLAAQSEIKHSENKRTENNLETATVYDTAYNTATSLLRLIDDISVLSSLDTDKDTLSLDSFDFIEALNSVVSLTRENFKAKNFNIKTDVTNTIEWIVGDSKRIRQMLYHLISGAVDGTGPGSTVTLTVQKASQSEDRSGLMMIATGPSLKGHGDNFHWTGITLIKHVSDLHGGTCDPVILEDGTRQVICRLPDNT